MSNESVNYVDRTSEGVWRVAGSRVSLASVVHDYWEGLSPESIQEDFPSLTLEQIHGAIAFYLRNRVEVDRALAEQEHSWEGLRQRSERDNGPLLDRLRAARTAQAKGKSA